MDALKNMLMTPKSEDIAHVAPEPLTHQVAAPVQPALKERSIPHSIASMFQPKSQTEDLAATSAPNAIQTQQKNFAMPTSGPTLQSKSFGGIQAKDLPFRVGTDQQISGTNNTAVIPVAVGEWFPPRRRSVQRAHPACRTRANMSAFSRGAWALQSAT